LVSSEAVLALLVAISASATSVSREREDGSLDILLTTPIQPGPYLAGKLRGLIVVLWPAIATPSITLMLAAMYVLAGGFGATSVMLSRPIGTAMLDVPMVLPAAAFAFLPCFAGFMAFTVMVGLQWSVGSRGVIGSTVGALGVVVGVIAVLGLCGAVSMPEVPILGPIVACLSPVNLARAAVSPETALPASLVDPAAMRAGFILGSLLATIGYGVLTWAMLAAIRRSFMMTVRRLSGLK